MVWDTVEQEPEALNTHGETEKVCGWAQVTWEAKQLEGTSVGDMGAKAAGGVLALLDLRADESLQEAGFAREVRSRLCQKLHFFPLAATSSHTTACARACLYLSNARWAPDEA